jgi:hypothetical protein
MHRLASLSGAGRRDCCLPLAAALAVYQVAQRRGQPSTVDGRHVLQNFVVDPNAVDKTALSSFSKN